jgi:thioesterase domain-containing protein/acyl carrier protein
MDKFPLTPNGKIDRAALPPPQAKPLAGAREFVVPRDPLEQTLANIWSRVLKVARVGLHDNFFDLGGHSLGAVSMLLDVKKLTGKTLPLATLFQAPTVSALADLLRQAGWRPSWSSLVPIRPQGTRSPLFLVHGAEGNVLLYRQVSQYLEEGHPVYGLQSRGLDGKGILDRTIGEMASRYVKEIIALQPHGPYIVGGYCMGGTVALEMARQLTSMGEQVSLVILLETYNAALFSRARSRILAPLHFAENLWFHVANVALLPPRERLRFLAEKASVELTRIRIRLQSLVHLLPQGSAATFPHLKIKQANDQAQFGYGPPQYSGRVAVIRSKWHFTGETSPSLGWSNLIRDGLEVHELPIYPRGMLVDPFCRSLAKTLNLCLRDT